MTLIQQVEAASITLFPQSRVAEFLPYFEETFQYGGINTPLRAAMFIGQVGIECDGFKTFLENLNYTKPEILIKVWPNRFRLPRTAEEKLMEKFPDAKPKRNPFKYLRQPEKLANFVYGGRMGNRGELSGDGWRFRGRGPKQLTGAEMYLLFTKAMVGILDIDFIKNPDALLDPRAGMYAATWYWRTRGLNKPADERDIDSVTRGVNGGLAKLIDREVLSNKTLSLLS